MTLHEELTEALEGYISLLETMEPEDHCRDMEQLYDLHNRACKSSEAPVNHTSTVVFYWTEMDEDKQEYDVNYIYELETVAPWLDLQLVKAQLLNYAEENCSNIVEEALEEVSQQLDFSYKFKRLVNTRPNEDPMDPAYVDLWIQF